MSGLTDKVDGPSFNVVIGMLLWVIDNDNDINNKKNKSSQNKLGTATGEGIETIKKWFKKFI